MFQKGRKVLPLLLAMLLIFSLVVTGCGSQAATEKKPADTAKEGPKKITIGLSNGYFGTDFRTQMLKVAEQVFNEYKDSGKIDKESKLIIQNAGGDINQQIQQFRNMINSGVNVIMVNANSATGLNGVIDEAKKAGIPVVSFDQAVTNPYAINITVDHYEWGKRYAEWMASTLKDQGKVVEVHGLPGHPASEDRKKAVADIFSKNSNIQVLKVADGYWDQARAQQVMTDLLAAYPNIDGVLSQDAMAQGVLRAIDTSNRSIKAMTGEMTVGYLKMWKAYLQKHPDFQGFAQANPPGISGSGMRVAVRLALGKTLKPLKDNTFYYNITKTVDNKTIDEVLKSLEGKPDTYFMDEWLTDVQADALFN